MERQRTREDLRPDELVEGVVPADVLADRDQLAARREERRRVQPAGLVERLLGGPQQVGQGERSRTVARPDRPAATSQRNATSSIDALPQIPHEAVATKCRSATAESSNGVDRRTTIVSSGWLSVTGSPLSVPTTSGPSISPSVRRKPTASSASWPGVRIVTATATGSWSGPGRADLERRLPDDAVAADSSVVPARPRSTAS